MNGNSGSAVLRAVLKLGAAPRSAVARHAGLSPATVTSQSRRLIEAGLLVELPDTTNSGIGRPFVPLAVNADANVALALHIAARHITVAVVDIAGRLIDRRSIPHGSTDPAAVLDTAATEIARTRQRLPPSIRVIGLGVAIGGWVDTAAGGVIEHPVLGWANVPIRTILSTRTGLHTEIDNHTRALVHAEHLFGRDHEAVSTVVLFVGNVIDTAFAVHGQVHYGQRAAAGSVASLVAGSDGARALLELADGALVERASQAGLIASADAGDLVEVASPGSPAHALFVDRATALGRMAATLIDLVNPDSFIVVDRAFETPGVCAAYRDAVRLHSVTGADPGIVVGSSFTGWVLPAAAAAVILWSLYSSPLALKTPAA